MDGSGVLDIVDILVAMIDLGHSYGHRAIEINGLLPELALLVQFTKTENNFLAAKFDF